MLLYVMIHFYFTYLFSLNYPLKRIYMGKICWTHRVFNLHENLLNKLTMYAGDLLYFETNGCFLFNMHPTNYLLLYGIETWVGEH
jgi:hypothetical protein